MSRSLAVFLVAPAVLLMPAAMSGQVTPIGGSIVSVSEPGGSFSFGVRFTGNAKVTFRNVGSIASPLDSGDLTGEMARFYHDGTVQLDSRAGTDGTDLLDDGFTNTWGFFYRSQVLGDQSGVAFHNYSTTGEGTAVDAESGNNPGVDMELGWRIAGYGKKMPDTRRSGSWGVMLGLGISDINAKTSDTIKATLNSITDVYSTDGAAIPIVENVSPPYSSPSSSTVTVTNEDGTTSQVLIDTSILLGNRPLSRTLTSEPGAADVEGFWQLKGTAASIRAGLWTRYYLTRRLSLRAAVGASYSLIGYEMRYDERLFREGIMTDEIRDAATTASESVGVVSVYGALDLELWFTAKTGLFLSVAHESVSREIDLELGGRIADIDLAGGTGFRIGLTTMF